MKVHPNPFWVIAVLLSQAHGVLHAKTHSGEGAEKPRRTLESLPSSLRIPEFGTPLVAQTDLYCWDHASRGVIEWLINRSQCTNPNWGGIRALNQEFGKDLNFINSNHAAFMSRASLPDENLERIHGPMHYAPATKNYFAPNTDVEQDLLFTTYQGTIYAPVHLDAEKDKQTGYGTGLRAVSRSTSYEPVAGGDLWSIGGVGLPQVQAIKQWMNTHQSPVLFTFVPVDRRGNQKVRRLLTDGRPYWHAAYIVGWNDKGFIVRDSSFGEPVRDPYRKGQVSRDTFVMPYQHFMDSAKSAAGYRLTGNVPTCAQTDAPQLARRPQQNPQTPSNGVSNASNSVAPQDDRFQLVDQPPTPRSLPTDRQLSSLPSQPPIVRASYRRPLPQAQQTVLPPRNAPGAQMTAQAQLYSFQGRLWKFFPLQQGAHTGHLTHGHAIPPWAIGYFLSVDGSLLSFAFDLRQQPFVIPSVQTASTTPQVRPVFRSLVQYPNEAIQIKVRRGGMRYRRVR